ncbi:MAG TPA: phage holin family protein [Longimicrobiales bacterium]|jgi:putative membrane protein
MNSYGRNAMRFLIRLTVTAAALWVAVRFVPGIDYDGHWAGLLGVAALFGVVNAVIRPLVRLLTCPLVFLTLGLFVFVINGLMLLLTAFIAVELGVAFTVTDLWAGTLGALVIGVVSALITTFVGDEEER